MYKGIDAHWEPPSKVFKRTRVVLNETIVVNGHVMEKGSVIEPFLLFTIPELADVLAHADMRRKAETLKDRWRADRVFIEGLQKCGCSFVRAFLTAFAIYLHSAARTLQLKIKDLLGIPRRDRE